MTPREIIAEAWAITRKERHLRRWGIASAFFETLRDVELLLYQAYFMYWYMKGVSMGWFGVEAVLMEHLPFWLFVTITAILIILIPLEMFVPTIASGSIIGLAAKAKRGEPVKGGLVLGLYNFFPILEVHGLFVLSGVSTLITAVSMMFRYAEGNLRYWVIGMFVLLWLIGTLFHFFASFAEEAIVIRKRGVFGAVSESFKLIISHLSHIMFLLLLLFVITIRIIINAVMVLVIPAIAIGVAFLLALFFSPIVSYLIAGFVGLLLIFGASYFFAYLHVFKQTVWTLTYMELSAHKDLDVIMDDSI
jgi:hypothetical protein